MLEEKSFKSTVLLLFLMIRLSMRPLKQYRSFRNTEDKRKNNWPK